VARAGGAIGSAILRLVGSFPRQVGSLLRKLGAFLRLASGVLGLVGPFARLVGSSLHLVGSGPRSFLLLLVGPFLRKLGGLLRKLGAFLRPDGVLLGLVGSFPRLVGSCPHSVGGLLRPVSVVLRLVGVLLRLESGSSCLNLRRSDTRRLGLASVPLLRSHLDGARGLRPRFPGPGRPPGHAVRLAGLRHAPAGGSLLGFVPSHDHLSWRVCPRLPAEVYDLTG